MGENTRRKSGQDAGNEDMHPWLSIFVKFGSATAHYALFLGGLATVISLGMIALGKTPASPGFAWMLQVQSAATLFLLIGFIALFFKAYESVAPGVVALILGAGFFFGSTYLVVFLAQIGKLSADAATQDFVQSTLNAFQTLGVMLLALGVIRLIFGGYTYLTTQHQTTAKKFQYMDLSRKDVDKISFIPQCWQMSRCRPAVRHSCPNFIDRKTCWGRRSGCFCDRELANFLLQSVDSGETTEVTDVAQAAAATATTATRTTAPRTGGSRPWGLQRALCYNCPLFIEHQEYKFKHLRFISLPMTLFVGVILYPFYDIGYQQFAMWLEDTTKKLMTGPLADKFQPTATSLGPGFEMFLGVVLLVLISSWIMELTERMFLKWNW